MKSPIVNKTVLNTSLYTVLSSGAEDNIMSEERSINNVPPFPLNSERAEKIYVGNRETTFLNQLFTNYFLIDFEYIDIGKIAEIQFSTTKNYSFSIHHSGNKMKNFTLHVNDDRWGKGNVRNLEKFFEGLSEDAVLNFIFEIHRLDKQNYNVTISYF